MPPQWDFRECGGLPGVALEQLSAASMELKVKLENHAIFRQSVCFPYITPLGDVTVSRSTLAYSAR